MKRRIFILLALLTLADPLRAEDNGGIEMLPDDPSTAVPSDLELSSPPAPEPTPKPQIPVSRREEALPAVDASGTYVARPSKKRSVHQHYWLSYFELGSVGAAHPSGGSYVIAPWIAWRPTFPIANRVQLRGMLYAGLFKNGDVNPERFTVISYEGFVALAVDHGWLEVGGGTQTWAGDNGGSHWVASVNIAAPFRRDYLGFIDRFVIGYSAFFTTPLVHELRLGLGVAF